MTVNRRSVIKGALAAGVATRVLKVPAAVAQAGPIRVGFLTIKTGPLVIDSAFVGSRKPEPEIYELTLERLGVAAESALLIDDVDVNCDAARALGTGAVWFRTTEQAIQDTEAALSAADGG